MDRYRCCGGRSFDRGHGSTKLVECINTNYLNIEQPTDSFIKKRGSSFREGKLRPLRNRSYRWIRYHSLVDSVHDRLLHQKSHGCGNVLVDQRVRSLLSLVKLLFCTVCLE